MVTNINKKRLLNILDDNKKEHRAIFEEAVEGYRTRSIEILEDHIAKIKANKMEKVYVSLPIPTDHTHDYDRVISMVQITEDEVVKLEEHEYAQYVLDDWAWQREFLMSSSNYSGMARAKVQQP